MRYTKNSLQVGKIRGCFAAFCGTIQTLQFRPVENVALFVRDSGAENRGGPEGASVRRSAAQRDKDARAVENLPGPPPPVRGGIRGATSRLDCCAFHINYPTFGVCP